ncbi:CLUMA_CG011905, isoform B [Clunio marinus]|uniref:Guanylate cyclase n=1 Tax=Clunio marinus TaxID=568069 RepID=A0A1J1IG90_9DIPT|nr:CLUMA_CG011905, isoform B [Clunio marinus]
MAERYIRKESLIPEYVEIKWLKYDDQCDAALASISAFDAYTNQCVHFIIGPSCEYCVSSVSRITKYFYNDGMNVITGGAFTFDFEEPKTTCKDQFYMLNRVGILSFEKISKFTTTLMQKYNWTKAAVLYDRNGYSRVGGIQTCHLMMSSMVKNFLETSIEYVPKIIDGYENSEKESEDLLREIGMAYGAVLLPREPVGEMSERSTQILATTLPVIELAIKAVKEKKILEGFELIIHHRDTRCSSTYGPIAAFDLIYLQEADVFLGPICDYVLAPVARYATVWNRPVLTTGGLAVAFNNKLNFPTLTRMLSYSEMTNAIKKIVSYFKWEVFGFFLYNFNDAGKGHSECSLVLSPFHRQLNGSSVHETFEHPTPSLIEEKLQRLKQKSRIIIMCANPKSIREIMIAAEGLNMIDNGEYVFINIEIFGSLSKESEPWKNETDTPERNEKAKKAYEALLTIATKKPEDEEYQKFSDEVKLLAKEKYNYTFEEHEQISQFVSAFHDAVLLFAKALNESFKELGTQALMQPLNGTRLTELMWGTTFKGITGNVSIDNNGDRLSEYSLLDMNPNNSKFEIVANYFHSTQLTFVDGKKIHWAGNRRDPPLDRPECGFDNTLCPENSSTMFAILSLVLGFVVIIMGVVSFLSYRHYKLEAEISSMTWKVNWNEVIPVPLANHIRSSIHSRLGSQLSVYSDEFHDRQIFVPIGCYKGNTVAIKRITSQINLTRSLMMELKTMKDIQHDHLVKFYGAVIEAVPCLLTEYCPKGSLQDILENHEITLDWMFKLSLMHDIAKGMQYLHTTAIGSHGQLKSSNCVVDSRFVLKITDYGLHDLRKTKEIENKESHEYWKKFLWTAPELLRLPSIPVKGTQKGDVYSFGIIVQEIVSRQGVFYLGENVGVDKTPKEIIHLVCNNSIYSNQPFRPIVEDNKDTCCDINSLMIKCWNEDPYERPDYSYVKSVVRKINKENESGNILDNLLKRMEHYANNLEELVEERTRDYFEEKKKCEELLYQLLPVSIASQLINGKSVMAEMFDQVTIYFSDIVGFTAISAESTPMQVVDLLNDLYTCFDKIVGNFDVYKVETIGDAYMVVSGLPVRNGDLHAREIARMALALLAKVRNFKIHHRPEEKLRLRIGMHSGSCCAGVVGQKMPRYCLFGDTVNTASRMESNGEALKIHMSSTTKQILDKFGSFDVTLRGSIAVKGKGEMMTYWLNGENVDTKTTLVKSTDFKSSLKSDTHYNERDEKPSKVVAVVPPLTPHASSSLLKKSVKISSNLLNTFNNSLKNLDHDSFINGKKSNSLNNKVKQVSLNNNNSENLQPLLS